MRVSKYVVVCNGKKLGRRGEDGLGEHAARFSGCIDDNRAQGGDIRVECFETMRRSPSNHVSYRFVCQVCIGLVWEADDGPGSRSGGGVLGRTGISLDGGMGDERGRNVLVEAGNLGAVIDKFAQIEDRLPVIRFPVLPAELEVGDPVPVEPRYVIPFSMLEAIVKKMLRAAP